MLKLHSRALAFDSPAGVTKAYSRRPKHGHPIYNNRFCNLISASHGNLTLQNVPFINIHVVDCPAKPKKHKHCCQLPCAHIIPLSGSESSVSKTKTSKIGGKKNVSGLMKHCTVVLGGWVGGKPVLICNRFHICPTAAALARGAREMKRSREKK